LALSLGNREAVRRAARRVGALLTAPILGLALAATVAHAQSRLGGIGFTRVRLAGDGHVQAWVSVVDAEGAPVGNLSARDFSVVWDGRSPQDLDIVPVAERDPDFQLTVLLDPELLHDRAGSLRSMLEALGGRAAQRDRLRIGFASGSGKSVTGDLRRAGDLADRLDVSGARTDGRLHDALFREVRALARLSRGHAGAVLLVTSGVESGSHHDVSEVLELSRAYAQHVPVIVLLLDSQGATDADRLSRLGSLSGGGYARLDNADGLSAAAVREVDKLRSAYLVSFRDPRWDARADHHGLDVSVSMGGEQRSRHAEVATAEVMARSGWLTLTLVVLGMVFLLGLLAAPVLWRRPLLKLVVLTGEEKGCSYELYRTPVTLGAAVGNDLSFDEDLVSRNHAVFERRGSAVELVDLNSENGTFVNGDRISRRRLSRGDRVSLGGAIELEVRG
jgi:hypothetical protein